MTWLSWRGEFASIDPGEVLGPPIFHVGAGSVSMAVDIANIIDYK
jgi:hypothetical protein